MPGCSCRDHAYIILPMTARMVLNASLQRPYQIALQTCCRWVTQAFVAEDVWYHELWIEEDQDMHVRLTTTCQRRSSYLHIWSGRSISVRNRPLMFLNVFLIHLCVRVCMRALARVRGVNAWAWNIYGRNNWKNAGGLMKKIWKEDEFSGLFWIFFYEFYSKWRIKIFIQELPVFFSFSNHR